MVMARQYTGILVTPGCDSDLPAQGLNETDGSDRLMSGSSSVDDTCAPQVCFVVPVLLTSNLLVFINIGSAQFNQVGVIS